MSRNSFFSAFLQKYSLFIGPLERSDRAESGKSQTLEKRVVTERKKWILRIQYMATCHDGTFYVNMTSSIGRTYTSSYICRFLLPFRPPPSPSTCPPLPIPTTSTISIVMPWPYPPRCNLSRPTQNPTEKPLLFYGRCVPKT